MVENTTPEINAKKTYKFSFLLILCLFLVFLNGVLGYAWFFTIQNQKKANDNQALVKEKSLTLPSDAVKISGCIPHEGEHWVQMDKLPFGPFYVVYENKIIAIEYMFTEDDIKGKDLAHKEFPAFLEYMAKEDKTLSDVVHDLEDLSFELPDTNIKSWSMHWTAPHAGLPKPHYDVHMYLVDRSELENICPDSTVENALPESVFNELKKLGVPLPGDDVATQEAKEKTVSPSVSSNVTPMLTP